MRLGWLAWAAVFCTMTLACSQDIEGLRTPRSPANQFLGIRWHQGFQANYRWQLTRDYSVLGDKPFSDSIAGDFDLSALSVDADGVALVRVVFKIDPQYLTGVGSGSYTSIIGVGPRGRVTSNPDQQFGDLDRFYVALPLLPPPGTGMGDRWHETYKLPNPIYGNTRDLSVTGQYVRDEGNGFARAVVIQAHITVTYDDSVPYERLYGPPPSGAPPHLEEHMRGSDITDVTYRFDPALQSLAKSTATFQLNHTESLTDATNGKPVGAEYKFIGTETLTFTRS